MEENETRIDLLKGDASEFQSKRVFHFVVEVRMQEQFPSNNILQIVYECLKVASLILGMRETIIRIKDKVAGFRKKSPKKKGKKPKNR